MRALVSPNVCCDRDSGCLNSTVCGTLLLMLAHSHAKSQCSDWLVRIPHPPLTRKRWRLLKGRRGNAESNDEFLYHCPDAIETQWYNTMQEVTLHQQDIILLSYRKTGFHPHCITNMTAKDGSDLAHCAGLHSASRQGGPLLHVHSSCAWHLKLMSQQFEWHLHHEPGSYSVWLSGNGCVCLSHSESPPRPPQQSASADGHMAHMQHGFSISSSFEEQMQKNLPLWLN